MQKYSLNKNWEVAEGTLRNPLMMGMLQGWQKCHLPHDYSMAIARDPKAPTEDNEGWTQGAAVFYKKEFVIDEAATGKQFWLELEGISGVCEIWVNRQYVAKHMNPYTGVLVEVTDKIVPGENLIQVHLDSRMKPCSRWYVGTGLYRGAWLHVAEPTAVAPEGLQVTTGALDENKATLDISARLTGKADSVDFCLKNKVGQVLASVPATLGGADGREAAAKLEVSGITPWCPEMPELYFVEARVMSDGTEDIAAVRTGIRTIEVDSKSGFKLNGKPMKLKGGCVHHDLGLLGVAAYPAAERRRISILKESGYNAVRGAHNPFGPAFYDACDELGMLAVEEAFDEWVLGRTDFGLHITFEDRWERDIEDMIRRDYNHPSIIMWSTGNEVEERDGSADGFAWSRKLAEKVKGMDQSRPVSAAACSLFIEYTQRPADGGDKGATGNQALNMAYDNFASGTDLWGDTTEQYFAPLDVAGYNYKTVRYEHDGEKFPDRVIYGSETYPRAALANWQATVKNNNVIGDFVWTAWDYIGEAGVGRWEVSEEPRPAAPAYPWLLANCSDIDLIGEKRPQSHYRDVVWSVAKSPRIFCLPPTLVGKNIARLSWAWLPVQRSYSFAGCEGQPVEVHVYADADAVELLQNGVSMGRQPCGENEEYSTVFSLPYVPGKLEAVAYRNGEETGRDTLQTAGATAALKLCADRPAINADDQDLCFITIRAVDTNGVPVYDEDANVTVTVQGGGKLLAFGSADPKPDRPIPYGSDTAPLYGGAAMAVVRSESSAKGCMVEVALENGIKAQMSIGFAPIEADKAALVGEPKAGPLDLPLGELMENEQAMAALKRYMGAMIDNPMIDAMKGMSLKKLTAMGGQGLPAGLETALTDGATQRMTQ